MSVTRVNQIYVEKAGAIFTCEAKDGWYLCAVCRVGLLSAQIGTVCKCGAKVCGVFLMQVEVTGMPDYLPGRKVSAGYKARRRNYGWECPCGAVNGRDRQRCRKCDAVRVTKEKGKGEKENGNS